MALSEIYELPFGEWATDSKGIRKTFRKFWMQTDLNDSPYTATAYVPVSRGDSHPDDPYTVAKEISVKCHPDENTLGSFMAIINYDNSPWDEPENNSDPDKDPKDTDQTKEPDTRAPSVTYGGIRIQKVLEIDKTTNKAVTNSLGQKFSDPALLFNAAHRTIHISGWKSIADVDPDAHVGFYYMGVNDNNWHFLTRNYGAKTLLVTEDNWVYSFEQDQWWLKYTITLEYAPETWAYKVANMGVYKSENLDGTGELEPIFMKNPMTGVLDVRVTTPVPIDVATGQPKAAGAAPDILTFWGYDQIDFTNLL